MDVRGKARGRLAKVVGSSLPYLALFLAGFLLRAIYPISRTPAWFIRSYSFLEAVSNGEWSATYQNYHPGVTLMWLSSLGVRLFFLLKGKLSMAEWTEAVPVRYGLLEDAVTFTLAPVALAIAIGIVVATTLIRRLSSRPVAFVAGAFLVLDPIFLAFSKVIHVDALLSILMLVSALAMICFQVFGQRRYLVLSAVTGGLALLTKTPSIFLAPYVALILGLPPIWNLRSAWRTSTLGSWGRRLLSAGGAYLFWAFGALFVFVLLFPAVWTRGGFVLEEMVNNLLRHADTPHKNPVFFAGKQWLTDPGPLFYAAIIAWKTTLIALPLTAIGLVAAFRSWRRVAARVVLAMAAFALFFFIQMSLGEFKQMAYILPVFPALAVMQGYGAVTLATWVSEGFGRPSWRRLLVGLLLVAQAVLVLRTFPHFGVHHNLLLGGTPVAQQVIPLQEQGEGMSLAAHRLTEEYSVDGSPTAATMNRNGNVFSRSYAGETIFEPKPRAAFRVYDVNSLQRETLDEGWADTYERDRQREPLFTVDFDGVTYVWVYGTPPSDPTAGGVTREVDVEVSDKLLLKAVSVNSTELEPGDTLAIKLLWQTTGLFESQFSVFNHLYDSDGERVAQVDGPPLDQIRPMRRWSEGETLEDVYEMQLPADLAAGEYTLALGMYDPFSGERLPLYDESDQRLRNDVFRHFRITIAD